MLQLQIYKTGTLNHNTEYYSSACFPAITSYRVSVVVYITTNLVTFEHISQYWNQYSGIDIKNRFSILIPNPKNQ